MTLFGSDWRSVSPGTPTSSWYIPTIMKRHLEWGAACNRTGTAGQAAFRIRNSEGKYRWFLSRLEPLRASDGTLLYWIGINLDIEKLKHAEEQRRTAEEKIREQEMELRHALVNWKTLG
jgi:hypothetical protein